MKKLICLIVFLTVSTICFAQDADMKFYTDFNQGFSGWAMSVYLDDLKKEDVIGNEDELLGYMDQEISAQTGLTAIPKLTKKNTWLFKQALNEWDYEPGEVYAILCADSKYADDGILIFTIIKRKDECLWRAYSININDIDKIFK